MQWSRRLARSPAVQRLLGYLVAQYLRLVWYTSRVTIEPADIYQTVVPDLPVIIAMWHGQHFMVPFVSRGHRVKVLISRHRDGEINARAAERLGIGTVRGSGDHGGRFDLKGGVGAFKMMLGALAEGYNMALTADVPKLARVAGPGIIKLSRMSRRPIYPVAVATSRRFVLNNWDRSAINLPFSRVAIVAGDPLPVPAEADEAIMEQCRIELERRLVQATARAYAIADRRDGGADG